MKNLIEKREFSREDVDILPDDTVYSSFFSVNKIRLCHQLFGGWIQPMEREVFVRCDAVAAVIYTPANDLVGLIQQFRIGTLANTLNAPDAPGSQGPWLFEVNQNG